MMDNKDVSLTIRQTEQVNSMRKQLVAFDSGDPNRFKKAMQNITVLRVYHQMTRIIRYTDMMNKLEDKMYESLESAIDQMDPDDMSTWHTLISIQNKLQENMIQSHKLLEPYLNMEALTFVEVKSEETDGVNSATILTQDSREKLRNSAQEVLRALEEQGSKLQPTQLVVRDIKPHIMSKEIMKEGING